MGEKVRQHQARNYGSSDARSQRNVRQALLHAMAGVELSDLGLDSVSPARLLEYRIQDGWEPLCTFVGLPVPDVPFPNSNDSAMMQGLMQKVALRGLFRWAVVATATAALVLGFRSFLI